MIRQPIEASKSDLRFEKSNQVIIIIIERVRKWYNKKISDHQQGFRQGRGTTDGIYLVKRIQQLSYRSKKPIFVLFVDLSAAFDHINRKWLFKSIYQMLATKESEKLFKLLEKIYAFTTTALQENEKEIFNVILGVRQGGPESPTLFNLYIDYVMRIYLTDCKKHGINFMKSKFKIPNSALCNNELLGKYGENYITWLGYADDLVLFFEDKDNLKKALILLNDTFRRFQLNINAKKTETMILNFNDLNYQEYPDSLCELVKCKIKNVKLFKYLGSNIDYRDASTGDSEINQRLDSAEAKFFEKAPKLQSAFTDKSCNTKCISKKQTYVRMPNLDAISRTKTKDQQLLLRAAATTSAWWIQEETRFVRIHEIKRGVTGSLQDRINREVYRKATKKILGTYHPP